MSGSWINNLVGTALAQGEQAGAAAPAAQPNFLESMLPILLIFVAMYFVLIRPQVKRAKEHANLVKAIKVGDEVVTSGGIIGRIKSVADDFVTLDIGNAQLKVLKEHISRTTKTPADGKGVAHAKTT